MCSFLGRADGNSYQARSQLRRDSRRKRSERANDRRCGRDGVFIRQRFIDQLDVDMMAKRVTP